MSAQPPSRFTTSAQTTHERLSTTTVGLVALSDFRKRRAEVLEQQEREAREALNTPDRSQTGTPANGSDASDTERQLKKQKNKKKRSKLGGNKLSFAADDGDEDEDDGPAQTDVAKGKKPKAAAPKVAAAVGEEKDTAEAEAGAGAGESEEAESSSAAAPEAAQKADPATATTTSAAAASSSAAKLAANASVGVVPRVLTKAALRREAAERDALRREFLELQAAVKNTDIAIPFVFYDGANTPGGTVHIKKGDFVWVLLDKSRKVGATLGVGAGAGSGRRFNARRDWARVGVDDLMLVRGTIIIPHHFEFYFFIVNKTMGPGNRLLFDYSAEAPPAKKGDAEDSSSSSSNAEASSSSSSSSDKKAPVLRRAGEAPTIDVSTLEGARDDPNFTKIVDRRWYERNKHIYPASVWQEFEPEKDYRSEVKRDLGGNTFFYSR